MLNGFGFRSGELIGGIIEGRMKRNQQEGEEKLKCYTIWQMMVALFHSNGQLRTERYGDTEKGCQKPAVQQNTTDDDDLIGQFGGSMKS